MASVRRFEDALRQGQGGPTCGNPEDGAASRTGTRVLQWLRAVPGQSLLDLGCLSGDMLRCATELPLTATGLEFSPVAAAMAQKSAPAAVVFIGSLAELPFESSTFHLVTSLGAPAECFDPRSMLAEIYRVLEPGGRACLVLNLERRFSRGEADSPIEPWAPAADTFSGWEVALAGVGFGLLDAWPEAWLWRRQPPPRFWSASWGLAWRRRCWAWWPAWQSQPVVFLAEKPSA